MALHELSLFSGAGGGLLGSKLLGWKTICAVEQDPYCIEVLKQRQRDGLLEPCPIWDDVRTFDGRPWRGLLHHGVVSAGFPCQPFSLASDQQAGESEKNMWPDTARILGQCLPAHILLENVPGLLGAGKGPGRQAYFGTILGDLSSLGYDCRWGCISARGCGAPHIRDRLWIVGHANRDRQPTLRFDAEMARMPELVAHAIRLGRADVSTERTRKPSPRPQPLLHHEEKGERSPLTGVDGLADGLANGLVEPGAHD